MTDFAIVTLSIWIAYKLYRLSGIGQSVIYPKDEIIPVSIVIGLFTVFTMRWFNVYRVHSGILNVDEISNTTKGLTVAFLLIMVVLVFGKVPLSRYVIIFSYITSLTLIIAVKTYLYHAKPFTTSLYQFNKKILIYGAGELGQALYRELNNSPKFGIIPIGFIDDSLEKVGKRVAPTGFDTSCGVSILGNRHDINKLVKTLNIDAVYIAISNIDPDSLVELLNLLKKDKINWAFVPKLYATFVHKLKIEQIGQIPLISETEFKSYYVQYVKRIFDIICSSIITIAVLPIMIGLGILIKLDSKGPVFFKQDRVGKGGKLFKIYKFRSMYVDARPYAVNPFSSDDPRITRIGKYLRKLSLDEIPQLLNVLNGEMSLVGPRPEMPFIVDQYNEIHRERLKVLPGITGLWQLSGDRKKAIHENMDYDLYYIRNVSFFMDIAILIETLVFAFKGI